jgi:general secretion pathway protein E
MAHLPIGTLLLERGQISKNDIEQALAFQREAGGYLGQALLRLGSVSEDALLDALSSQLGLPIATSEDLPRGDRELHDAAEKLGLPVRWLNSIQAACWFDKHPQDGAVRLSVAALNPMKPEIQEAIEAGVDRLGSAGHEEPSSVRYLLAGNAVLDLLKSQMQASTADSGVDGGDVDTQRLREMAEEAPVIDYVNRIFAASLREGASDIHIEPYEHSFSVRFRIDGILHAREPQSRGRFNAVASRIKLLSGMDIAEQRLPQDGRQTIRFAGETLDLRVSSLPGTWGESLVLRLLRKEQSLPSLEALGLVGHARKAFDHLMSLPNGIVLITGPTGSGKSTTLYRCLAEVNDGVQKIITVEDPVEYQMAGITQIQVKPEIGYTFARGLRAILRQDPDVIMIGEIRDSETAVIASQAALTGHLVFSTLHTNSAFMAIERLLDLGLQSFLIGSSVRGVAAQRLARRLCAHCAVPASSPIGERLLTEAMKLTKGGSMPPENGYRWMAPVGCASCNHTGYRGRLAVYEVASIDEPLREAIMERRSASDLESIARRQGFMTLLEDGLSKAAMGLTSVEEVFRSVGNTAELEST